MEELSQDNLDKTTKEANLNKLRDEFNKKRFNNQNHPKTSHIHKNSIAHSSLNFNISKKYPRTNKALSAYSFNQKVGNVYKLNDKQYLDFYKKHPGYLYYKEIIASMKSKQLNINKKRAFTGKNLNKKIKFGNTNYNYSLILLKLTSSSLEIFSLRERRATFRFFLTNIFSISSARVGGRGTQIVNKLGNDAFNF